MCNIVEWPLIPSSRNDPVENARKLCWLWLSHSWCELDDTIKWPAAAVYVKRSSTESHMCVINSTIIIIIQYSAKMNAKIADVRVEWFDKTIPIILDSRCLMYVSLCVLIISEIIYIARSFYLYSVFTTFTYYSYDALVSHSHYVCFLAHSSFVRLLCLRKHTHTHTVWWCDMNIEMIVMLPFGPSGF